MNQMLQKYNVEEDPTDPAPPPLSSSLSLFSKCNQHPDLGFYLTEFHKFWCLSISAGGYQEIWKKGPHVGIT